MRSSEASFTADGLQMLNSVCDEFRRKLKADLLKSGSNSPVSPLNVLRSAEGLQRSPWLTKFQEDDSDDSERRAA
jgi:hypothetical protein